MDPALRHELTRRGGAVRLADLGPHHGRAVAADLRSGAVQVAAGKVLAIPEADPGVVAALAVRGTLVDLSAARWHGLPVVEGPARPRVAVPRASTRRRLAGVDVVRRDLPLEDLHPYIPVTTALRTVVDCARHHPFDAALAVADGAAARGLVMPDQLVRVARRVRGPGARGVRQVARMVEPRCESLLETVQRLLLLELGLPFELQVELPGVGRVDAVVDGWLVCEPDGFEFHRGRADYRRDRRRGQAIAAAGLGLLRFSYEDLVLDRRRTAQVLLQTLATRRAA